MIVRLRSSHPKSTGRSVIAFLSLLGMTAVVCVACGDILGGSTEPDPSADDAAKPGSDGGGDATTNDTGTGVGIDASSGDASGDAATDAKDGCQTKCPTKTCTNGDVCDFAVFITSATFDGWLGGDNTTGGIPRADARCAEAAALATPKITRTMHAWLSVLGVDALSRLSPTAGPYRRLDGQLVADTIPDLVANAPKVGITVQEYGQQLTLNPPNVWTGTYANGTAGPTCTSWTKNVPGVGQDYVGAQGLASATSNNGDWTQVSGAGCGELKHLYCFEQP